MQLLDTYKVLEKEFGLTILHFSSELFTFDAIIRTNFYAQQIYTNNHIRTICIEAHNLWQFLV